MTFAYIAHPISGDVPGNLAKILQIVRTINLHFTNVVPCVPYLADLLALNDDVPEHRERGIKNDHALIRAKAFNVVWLFGPRISNGMWDEAALAVQNNTPVFPASYQILQEMNAMAPGNLAEIWMYERPLWMPEVTIRTQYYLTMDQQPDHRPKTIVHPMSWHAMTDEAKLKYLTSGTE